MSSSTTTGDDKDQQQQLQYKTRCDKFVSNALSRNMTVQFLIDNLIKLGCQPPPNFIKCMDCGDKQAGGGFGVVVEKKLSTSAAATSNSSSSPSARPCTAAEKLKQQLQSKRDGTSELKLAPEIYLCQEHLRDEQHAHESLTHELIHAIDACRTKMDPFHNCIHLACTEIRAENLSGECSLMHEVSNGQVSLRNFAKHGEACVRRRAALSLKANPNCKDKAEEYVDAAFERCFRDTFPFDRHPNLR